MAFVVNLTDVRPPPRYDGVAWDRARVEQSVQADGPWAPVETFTLSPADPDPTDPQARDFTTNDATLAEGWFRVVFLDPDDAESAVLPIHLPPLDDVITLAEFKAYANIAKDSKDELAASMLRAALAQTAQVTGRQLVDLGATTITRRVGRGDFVRLPDARTIDSVKVDGAPVPAGGWVAHPEGEATTTHIELVDPARPRGLVCQATGTFGLLPLPDDLRGFVLAVASRFYFRRQAGFADTLESTEYGMQSFFRTLPADLQATAQTWTVKEALVA